VIDNPIVLLVLGIAAAVVIAAIVLVTLSGGDGRKTALAVRFCFRVLRDPAFADKVRPLLQLPEPVQDQPAKPSGVPLRVLALLQREGRLVDFLLEDIEEYHDAQIGAAVRNIHRQCQAVLKEHLVLEPVLAQAEGADVEVPSGFDPSAIRLVGNVTGQPPFRGILLHHGWQVTELKLVAPPEGQDELVLMPAEVELP